jgi:hypothetical protein
VVGDRASVKEYLRLLSSVLALVSGKDAGELAKVKPFAVEAVQVRGRDLQQQLWFGVQAVL